MVSLWKYEFFPFRFTLNYQSHGGKWVRPLAVFSVFAYSTEAKKVWETSF